MSSGKRRSSIDEEIREKKMSRRRGDADGLNNLLQAACDKKHVTDAGICSQIV